jgi:hypothetical protein
MENSQGGGVGTLEDMVSSWSCGELLTFADLGLVVGQDPVQRSVKTGLRGRSLGDVRTRGGEMCLRSITAAT